MRSDWSAGILACMSAKHEQAFMFRDDEGIDAAEAATLQARMPAVQSVDEHAGLKIKAIHGNSRIKILR